MRKLVTVNSLRGAVLWHQLTRQYAISMAGQVLSTLALADAANVVWPRSTANTHPVFRPRAMLLAHIHHQIQVQKRVFQPATAELRLVPVHTSVATLRYVTLTLRLTRHRTERRIPRRVHLVVTLPQHIPPTVKWTLLPLQIRFRTSAQAVVRTGLHLLQMQSHCHLAQMIGPIFEQQLRQ